MDLTVKDVARLLNASEKTIYRWIQQGELPVYRLKGSYRFSRAELLEWATSKRLKLSPELIAPQPVDTPMEPQELAPALEQGGIFYRVEGRTRSEVLHAVVGHMRLPEQVDRSFLFQVLMAREDMASTGIGDGIACPHPRSPIVLGVTQPSICLSFLETPVDYGALDGRPVYALFTLVSTTVRAHLELLSRLSFALRDPGFHAAIEQQGTREQILEQARRLDASLQPGPTAVPGVGGDTK